MMLPHNVRLLVLLVILSGCTSVSPPRHLNALARQAASQADEVVRLLNIKKGEAIADLGAGGGYFTLKLAKATGENGAVYAVDIRESNLDYVSEYLSASGVNNVKLILAETDDPKLPAHTFDLIFVRNTYHDLTGRAQYFSRLRTTLKENGRIAIIDHDGAIGYFTHSIERAVVVREMESAGYQLIESYDVLPRQLYLIFTAATDDGAAERH